MVGCLLLAWGMRLYRLGAQSFWYDEGYAAYIAGLGPPGTLLWSSRDFVPPLHAHLLGLWLPLAGWTEFAARFLSAWAGLLTTASLARLSAELHSRKAGLVAGMLVACSPFYVRYSQEARMYMCQAMFGVLATLCLVRALRRPEQWRYWVGLGLFDALALYTQVTSGFLLAFHGAALLAIAPGQSGGLRDRAVLIVKGGAALAGAMLAWAPWVVYALPFLRSNAGYWPGLLDWRLVFGGTLRGFVTGEVMGGAAGRWALAAWGMAGLAGVVALLAPGRDPRGRRAALFLLMHYTLPVALMAWLFRTVPKFSPRYLIIAAPPLFLLPAMGIASVCRGRSIARWPRLVIGGLLTALLAAMAAPGLAGLYFDPAYARTDFRAAARLVRGEMAADEVVLLIPGPIFAVWQFYFGPTGWAALPDDPILDVRHVLHYRNTVGRLNELLAGRSGAWLVEWEPQMVDPTGVAPYLLAQLGEESPLGQQPHGLRVRHYRFAGGRAASLPDSPSISPPASSSLDLPLRLVGCDLPPQVRGDEPLRVGCYWEAQCAPPDCLPLHLAVSARLVDEAGVEWGRADTAIAGPYLVAGRLPLAEPALGQYQVAPFPGTPPGDFYALALWVYEGATFHGSATVGPLTLARPARPFTETLAGGQVLSATLGGLLLEAARIRPARVLPGEEIRVEAIWRVQAPFDEPAWQVDNLPESYPLLPRAGAAAAWRIGDRYRTITRLPISRYAPGGETTLWATAAHGRSAVGAVHVDITRTFDLPMDVPPLDYRLGDNISLIGARLAHTGNGGEVVLYWQAHDYLAQAYTVFVQMIGPDGRAYAQADSWPQAGRHPTDHWLPGEVVADPYRLELPAGAPPGVYHIIAGMYDLATMERLPVMDALGQRMLNDAIVIGEWEFE